MYKYASSVNLSIVCYTSDINIIGTPGAWPTHVISNDLIGCLTSIHMYMLDIS